MNESISIFDALYLSDYPINKKDYILSILLDAFTSEKNVDIYLTNKTYDSENKIIIKYILTINFKGKDINLPLLIYLPLTFPETAPDIYIEKIDEIAVSPVNKYTNENLKIISPLIKNWNNQTSFHNILNEIIIHFNENFPIYKLDIRERGKYNYAKYSIFNKIGLIKVNIYSNESKYAKNIFKEKKEHNNNLSVDKAINLFKRDLSLKLIDKIKTEININRKYESTIVEHNNKILDKYKKINECINNRDLIISSFDNNMKNIDNCICELKDSLANKFEFDMILENLNKIIKIDNNKIIELIAYEAYLEEFQAIIKKAFLKGILNLSESIKMIRSGSREIIRIKFYRDKKTNL